MIQRARKRGIKGTERVPRDATDQLERRRYSCFPPGFCVASKFPPPFPLARGRQASSQQGECYEVLRRLPKCTALIAHCSSQFSILNTQYSLLNTQYSIPNTQYSILTTQYSMLNTQYSILRVTVTVTVTLIIRHQMCFAGVVES